MKQLILASLITLLAFATACGLASEPAPQPVASDGIQVHGHWTVTVTNPDGTVEAVREFENALYHGGSALTAVLANEASVDGWELVLGTVDPWQNTLDCDETTNRAALSYHVWVPAVATRDAITPGNPIMISGTCTVSSSTTPELYYASTNLKLSTGISLVPAYSPHFTWAPTIFPDALPFTTHELSAPISLVDRQIVSFNVSISFS